MSQTVDERLHCVSTLVLSQWISLQSSASGFFFQEVAPPSGSENVKLQGGEWRKIEGVWLVTNRHVLVNANQLATSITFHHRKLTPTGFQWVPITISADDL